VLVNDKGTRINLSIRPSNRHNPQVICAGRHTGGRTGPRPIGGRGAQLQERTGQTQHQGNASTNIPTEKSASGVPAKGNNGNHKVGRQSMNPPKKTKGLDGPFKGGATAPGNKDEMVRKRSNLRYPPSPSRKMHSLTSVNSKPNLWHLSNTILRGEEKGTTLASITSPSTLALEIILGNPVLLNPFSLPRSTQIQTSDNCRADRKQDQSPDCQA
jgi:hypothetical protein